MLRKLRYEIRAFCELEVLKLESRSTGTANKREMVLRVSRLGFKQSPVLREMNILCRKRTKPDVWRDSVLRLLITFNKVRTKTCEFQLPIIVEFHYLIKTRRITIFKNRDFILLQRFCALAIDSTYSEGFTQIEMPGFSHRNTMKTRNVPRWKQEVDTCAHSSVHLNCRVQRFKKKRQKKDQTCEMICNNRARTL